MRVLIRVEWHISKYYIMIAMKTSILTVLLLLITQGVSAQVFTIDANGIVKCPAAQVGDKGTIDGIEYEAVDRTLLIQRRDQAADLTKVCTSLVTDMSFMFQGSQFNQPIGDWDVGAVMDMSLMFQGSEFNQPIGDWDVGAVIDMSLMFQGSQFNQPIGDWDVGAVTNMSFMFQGSQFNQDIGGWDVGAVTNMSFMFNSSPFNQPIGGWDVGAVTNMSFMFSSSQFNQPINFWCVTNIASEPVGFSIRSPLSPQNKPVWGTCPPSILDDPVSVSITYGDDATFEVAINFDDDNAAFQWQVLVDANSVWTDLADDALYDGSTERILTLTIPPVSMSGHKYRVQVTCASPVVCYTVTSDGEARLSVAAKELTLTGLAVNDKVYDGTNIAMLAGANASLNGVISIDVLDIGFENLYGTFDDTAVGDDKPVTTNLALTGSNAGNYFLTQPAGLTASIKPLILTIGGTFTANDKPFDENTDATFASNNLFLGGVLAGDDGEVTLANLAIDFDDASFDGLQPVRITAADLEGPKAGNYQLSLVNSPTTQARIIMFRVSGYKFNDLNGNGTWDGGEPGQQGWTIQIQGSAGSYTRVTDADGLYSFEHILPGNYQVREVNQEGWVQSAPGGEGFANVTVSEPRMLASVNFGNWKYSTVAGSVYKDLSGEGARDASSQDFEGVSVVLRNLSNVVIGTEVTDASGVYLFEDVAPGHYYITVTAPGGYSQSFPGSGSGYNVIVTSGSELSDYAFGLFQPVTLTGNVRLTQPSKLAPGDGNVQDQPIPTGVTVSGARTGSAPLKLAYASSSFEFELPDDGFFSVDNLLPGLYQVQISLPEYYFSVTENPITVQLSANTAIQISFDIQYDVENAPEAATSSISGSVFFDADGSGTWTDSEPGAGSQTVNLNGKSQRGDDVSRTSSSGADGSYTFDKLPAGEYHVSVAPSAGLSPGWPVTGGLTVKLEQNEVLGGARIAVAAMASAQAGSDASFASMTLALDTNLDGTADIRVDVSGKMAATLGGFAGEATRPAAVVSFSGMGTDSQGNEARVTVPGMYSSTGSVTTTGGQSRVNLGVGMTVVLDGQVLYASAPVNLSGAVSGWPFRGVSLTNSGQAPVDLRDPFGTIRARIVHAEFTPLHGVDLGVERADFGDAPASYGTNRATSANPFVVQAGKLVYPGDGARHLMPPTGNPPLMLGKGITADANGKPSELGNADTDDGVDMASAVSRGGTLAMDIMVTGVGKLSAWADWNRDGRFGAGEQILAAVDVDGSLGVYNLSATVPADAAEGLTFVRFRLSSQSGVGPTGMALNGEVEDYALTVGALASGGGGTATNDDAAGEQPAEFSLAQNFPNPFNPTTQISFTLARSTTVRLEVFNSLGQPVSVIADGQLPAGLHTYAFDGAALSSGVYLYRLTTSGFIQTRVMSLVK